MRDFIRSTVGNTMRSTAFVGVFLLAAGAVVAQPQPVGDRTVQTQYYQVSCAGSWWRTQADRACMTCRRCSR